MNRIARVMAVSFFAVQLGLVGAQDSQTIDGYGPLTFGMTLESARDASGKKWKEGCGGQMIGVWRCLSKKETVFGYKALVRAQFGEGHRQLQQFAMKFDFLSSADCDRAEGTILRTFNELYGPNATAVTELVREWRLPGEVTVTNFDLCMGSSIVVTLADQSLKVKGPSNSYKAPGCQ